MRQNQLLRNPVRPDRCIARSPAINPVKWPLTAFVLLTLIVPDHLAAAEPVRTGGPVKVQILQTNGGYQLYVDHQPFYIKGAGLESGSQEKLVEHGGNSLRTWRPGKQILDRALRNHLYVTLGLPVGRERQGFNYSDPMAVAHQLAGIKSEVLKYKDHPALIIWAIGNELNLNATNLNVWNAVNEISRMIHEVDPNHLTTTPLAGFKTDLVREVKDRAPDLDLLSFQMYGDIVNLPRYLRETGWTGPYLVTEWGATGHWEVGRTEWDAPIENDSTTKANFYRTRYEKAIQADRKLCIGSYVFLWGHKQERTPTWYGMFLESGEETAAIDAMQYLWTGTWPSVRCPQIEAASLDGKGASQNIHLKMGRTYVATIHARSDDENSLTYSSEVAEESRSAGTGGDFETKPRSLPGLVRSIRAGEWALRAPSKPGAYRWFAYVGDGKQRAAHANIPFFVDADGPVSSSGPPGLSHKQ
jgi:hypothetical protein